MFCPLLKEPCREDCGWKVKPYGEEDEWPVGCAMNLVGHFVAGSTMTADLPIEEFLQDVWLLIDAARKFLGETD